MILSLIASLLILGIAWYQAKQGMFSSLIMAVCATLATLVSLVSYRALAAATNLYSLQPTLAEGIALTVLFCLVLFVLRVLMDKFLPEDIHLPLWAEWGLGGLFGVIAGIMMVGTLLLIVQLLPVGENVLGLYRPFSEDLQRNDRALPFCPDELVAGLGSLTARGSLSGGEIPPGTDDLLRTAYCRRNTAGLGGRVDTEPQYFSLVGVYPGREEQVPDYPLLPARTETKVLVARVGVTSSASSDIDDWWRLPATQFALAGDDGKLYYPVGYLLWDQRITVVPAPEENGKLLIGQLAVTRPLKAGVYGKDRYTTSIAKPSEKKITGDAINLRIDWVYRIPVEVTPTSVIFRGTARADVTGVADALPANARDLMLKTQEQDDQDYKLGR